MTFKDGPCRASLICPGIWVLTPVNKRNKILLRSFAELREYGDRGDGPNQLSRKVVSLCSMEKVTGFIFDLTSRRLQSRRIDSTVTFFPLTPSFTPFSSSGVVRLTLGFRFVRRKIILSQVSFGSRRCQ